jgi:hypothetical protein
MEDGGQVDGDCYVGRVLRRVQHAGAYVRELWWKDSFS